VTSVDRLLLDLVFAICTFGIAWGWLGIFALLLCRPLLRWLKGSSK